MSLRDLLRATFLVVLMAGSAHAEGDGGANSPFFDAAIHNPLNTFKLRLGPPVLPTGPTNTVGDDLPTFIYNGPGQMYVFGANQVPWEHTATTPTSGYPSVEDGSTGANTQTVGHNYNSAPAGTATFKSDWSIPFTGEFPAGTSTPGLIPATSPGPATDQCGSWPTSAYKIGSLWYLWVHNEGPCDYTAALGTGQVGYTNESSSLWTSTTGAPGTWTVLSGVGGSKTIVSSAHPVELGWLTGIGDGTMVPGNDGFMYAYLSYFCSSPVCDYHQVIARAPLTNLTPGNWKFLFNGCFCAPALNNPWNSATNRPSADLLPFVGSFVATIPNSPYTALAADGKDHAFWKSYPGQNIAGIGLSIALDRINFYTFAEPLVNYDHANFVGRPLPDDLYLYTILRNDVDGGSVLNPNHFNLMGVWIPPNGDDSDRYTISWPVTKSVRTPREIAEGQPQIGLALENWQNVSTGHTFSGHFRTTTVNPFASSITVGGLANGQTEPGWVMNSLLGYVMTKCPGEVANLADCDALGRGIANRIEECWSGNTADDYQLNLDTNGKVGSCPSGWTHHRTIGWLYKTSRSFAHNPVYACLSSGGSHFSSADSACNGQTILNSGKPLGYALSN